MRDRYTFTNDEIGRAQRAYFASLLEVNGISTRKFEEEIVTAHGTFKLLKLEAGKRADEGKIARDMKARKQ